MLPLTMNGNKVYSYEDRAVTPPEFTGTGQLWSYIMTPMKPELDKLPDGNYYFSVPMFIVDEKGRVVYYETNCLFELTKGGRTKSKITKFNKELKNRYDALATDIKIKPAQLNGKPVLYFWSMTGGGQFEVKNHNAIFTNN